MEYYQAKAANNDHRCDHDFLNLFNMNIRLRSVTDFAAEVSLKKKKHTQNPV